MARVGVLVVSNLFLQVGIVLGVTAVMGLIARTLHQPLLVAFIAVGILLGPSALGIVVPSNEIELFARLGIALLLFVVGLRLDLHVIRTVGPVALATGLGQVFFTSAIGFGLALALGMTATTALYVAVALTFSSTIIIVKLLSDKREIETLQGRIAIGFLIVQDILVVLVMIGLTAFGDTLGAGDLGRQALGILAKGAAMLIGVVLLIRFVLPWLLPIVASSSELLMLLSIAMAVLGGALGDALGFSKEVGAFLAGVSLASTPYREQIAARLVSLRDFLLVFFFIELGAAIDLMTLGAQLPSALLLSLFVLIGNPMIVMAIMGVMGYRKQTSFLAGLTVAQISEFSLILASLGLALGHLTEATVGLIALVGLITISVSTYMILFSKRLYAVLAPRLGLFERRDPFRERRGCADSRPPVNTVVIGLGRYGRRIAETLFENGHQLLAIEIDPGKVEHYRDKPLDVAFGDATDEEFLLTLPLEDVSWLVFTVRDGDQIRRLHGAVSRLGLNCKLAMSAPDPETEAWLRERDVELVITPYLDAADKALEQLQPAIAANTSVFINKRGLPHALVQ